MGHRAVYYACAACGATRHAKEFGINGDGHDPNVPPAEFRVATREHFKGVFGPVWTHLPLTIDDAQALRARYVAVLAKLDAEITAAGGSVSDEG